MKAAIGHFGKAVREWARIAACQDPQCGNWNRRTRGLLRTGGGQVQLQNANYCFPECFERIFVRELKRATRSVAPLQQMPRRLPLGLMLLSRGELDVHQLQQALRLQKQTGTGTIGEWIMRLGFASESQITSALAAQWYCPVLRSIPSFSDNDQIPLAFLEEFQIVPVHYSERTRSIHLAFAGPIHYGALRAIERQTGFTATPCMTSPTELRHALAKMGESPRRSDQYFKNVYDPREITRVTSGHVARWGATAVSIAACDATIWVMLQASMGCSHLLFSAVERGRALNVAQGPVPSETTAAHAQA